MVATITRFFGYSEDELRQFIRESNAIEGVYDEQSFEDALWAWHFLEEQGRDAINPFLVLQVHEILMRNPGAWSEPQLLPKYRGLIRDCPVYIGSHEGMKHSQIKGAIEEWCKDMNKPRDLQPDGLEDLSKKLHVQYERIHPFIDGNGRTGRIFMNWWRLQQGLPLLIIREGDEQYEYYKWFTDK